MKRYRSVRTTGAHRLRATIAAIGLAIACLVGPGLDSAHATASYSATAELRLTILDIKNSAGVSIPTPAGLAIDGDAAIVPDAANYGEFLSLLLTGSDLSGAFGWGGATAGKSALAELLGSGGGSLANPGPLSNGDTVHQRSSVNGSAGGPGSGSIALQLTDGYVDFTNGAAEELTIVVGIEYLWSVALSATSPYESATAIPSLIVDAITETTFDTLLDIFEPRYVVSGDPAFSDSFSGAALGQIVIPAGGWGYLQIFVDAYGTAEIDEPSSLASFALLLAGLIAARRRTARRSRPDAA